MLKYAAVIAATFLLSSCGSPGSGKRKDAAAGANEFAVTPAVDYLTISGDSVLLPPFSVALHLSKAATEKLAGANESIIVTAWFSGLPKDTSSRQYHEWGGLPLMSSQVELTTGRIARFEGLKFLKSQYDSLASKDISVLINICSGRRSTPDNLLDCGVFSGKMSAVKDSTIICPGKLINETDSFPG